jgi:hypothetical protein
MRTGLKSADDSASPRVGQRPGAGFHLIRCGGRHIAPRVYRAGSPQGVAPRARQAAHA